MTFARTAGPLRPARWLAGAVSLLLAAPTEAQHAPSELTGRQLYGAACASCHGADGRGAPKALVGFEEEVPDFTDCRTVAREGTPDWEAVVHQGGPVRAFSHRMPAFGAALSAGDIARVIAYVRTLCTEEGWPSGDLNLPRPMETEKAFPEDETVVAASAVTGREERGVEGEVAFEKRFGARNQFELAVPFASRRGAPGEAGTFSGLAVGDLVVAYKRVLLHRAGIGTIVSAIGEVAFPTGDTLRGGGAGTTIFEPSIAAAQLLPFNSFLQVQGGVGIPADRERAERELFARAAFGTTLTAGYGRAFSPMVEVTRTGVLEGGEGAEWDVIPQLQVTLSRRQHVKASVGLAVPVAETAARPRRFVAYVIWDWFDGGLFDGW